VRPLAASAEPGAATWIGFALMGVGMFMAILDVQVVATSLPTIQAALKMAPNQMSWIQTAYLVAEVIAIPLTGFLTRLLSMRWLFVFAITTFTMASAGCAASTGFVGLIAWRVVQGFAGGTLIPAVFSAVFLLFPARLEDIATTIAGVLAVLAPTLGPIVGGWITQTYSWHWLFLINLVPGLLSAVGAAWLLPRERTNLAEARRLDLASLAFMAIALAALEIALKQAPKQGWASALVLGLLVLTTTCLILFARRTLKAAHPVVCLAQLGERNFAIACLLSFILGVGLYGSVYMMPVFLALVRGHGALEIGEIMLVTGLAQLATAPIAVALEKRIDARLLAGAGFAVFGLGLALSGSQTADTDFRQMLVPQIIRGSAIMFCLLPPTRLALGELAAMEIPDGSALFNLMRNLGGAIGLALIDTVIYGRTPVHARAITARLESGDVATATAVGIPRDLFLSHHGPIDAATRALLEPMVQTLALVRAINEAWLLAAAITFSALIALPLARRPRGPPI
jgi:DHA2 family multidrug resistance protein